MKYEMLIKETECNLDSLALSESQPLAIKNSTIVAMRQNQLRVLQQQMGGTSITDSGLLSNAIEAGRKDLERKVLEERYK